MQKYLYGVIVATALGMSVSALAGNAYVDLLGGYGWGTKAYGDTAVVGFASGYKTNENLRSDFTLTYRGKSQLTYSTTSGRPDVDVWSIPVIMNVYGTYPVYGGLGVYAMGGAGLSYNKTQSTGGLKGSAHLDLAYNVGVGIDYAITARWALDVGYRYTSLGRAKVKDSGNLVGRHGREISSHDILLSIRHNF